MGTQVLWLREKTRDLEFESRQHKLVKIITFYSKIVLLFEKTKNPTCKRGQGWAILKRHLIRVTSSFQLFGYRSTERKEWKNCKHFYCLCCCSSSSSSSSWEAVLPSLMTLSSGYSCKHKISIWVGGHSSARLVRLVALLTLYTHVEFCWTEEMSRKIKI